MMIYHIWVCSVTFIPLLNPAQSRLARTDRRARWVWTLVPWDRPLQSLCLRLRHGTETGSSTSCWDSHTRRTRGTATPTSSRVRPFLRGGVSHFLVSFSHLRYHSLVSFSYLRYHLLVFWGCCGTIFWNVKMIHRRRFSIFIKIKTAVTQVYPVGETWHEARVGYFQELLR